MVLRSRRGPLPQLEPRESVVTASSHLVFQVIGNLLAIIAVWVAFGGLLAATGTLGSGWQGRTFGVLLMVAAAVPFLLGKRMAIDNRVMRRRRE